MIGRSIARPSGAGGPIATTKSQAGGDQKGAQSQKAEIPPQGVADVVAHVVHGEDVVVDDALDEVEEAPADQQQPATPGATPTAGSPRGARV